MARAFLNFLFFFYSGKFICNTKHFSIKSSPLFIGIRKEIGWNIVVDIDINIVIVYFI